MGLGYAWDQLKSGDWGAALSGLYISDADISRDREVTAKLSALNAENRARGIWTEEEYRGAQQRLSDWSVDAMLHNEATSPYGGFKEGAAEGAAGLRKFGTDIINTAVGSVARSIPWQIWLLGGFLLAGWLYLTFFRRARIV
jgi:hypothetical protein